MPVRVSYKKQFLLLTMFLLVILSVIEVWAFGYDYFNPTKCDRPDPTIRQICLDNSNLIWYQDPVLNRAAFEPNQHMQTININNDGLRGSEIQKEKPNDTYLIIIVGGSTAFGLKVLSDQHTIPAHLQEKFDQLNLKKRVEVINAGISGYNSSDELNLIKKKIDEGLFPSGECLPRQHDLARECGVSFVTLRSALDILEREGYVVRKPGQGTYARLPEEHHSRALVVDDDPSVRRLFARVLSDGGWDSVCVDSAVSRPNISVSTTYPIPF